MVHEYRAAELCPNMSEVESLFVERAESHNSTWRFNQHLQQCTGKFKCQTFRRPSAKPSAIGILSNKRFGGLLVTKRGQGTNQFARTVATSSRQSTDLATQPRTIRRQYKRSFEFCLWPGRKRASWTPDAKEICNKQLKFRAGNSKPDTCDGRETIRVLGFSKAHFDAKLSIYITLTSSSAIGLLSVLGPGSIYKSGKVQYSTYACSLSFGHLSTFTGGGTFDAVSRSFDEFAAKRVIGYFPR
jgi:hypothetical protein